MKLIARVFQKYLAHRFGLRRSAALPFLVGRSCRSAHFLLPIALSLFCASAFANGPACPFDKTKMEFAGTPIEQARCLLRPVLRGGNLGQPLAALPQPLEKLIGQS